MQAVGLLSGLLFGLGLVVSGMISPAKVLAFLDVAGAWDPSLALVMAAAVSVAGVGFAIGRRLRKPLAATAFAGPTRRDIDANLIAGALLFGIGWGLAGFCPGPALASLSVAGSRSAVFVIAMLAGMGGEALFSRFANRRPRPA
ncbi:MAG TPA: DUF6691 family protein [Acidisphaera sp.]|nr:DUF6691 family protein [Acidisphaera sp.]